MPPEMEPKTEEKPAEVAPETKPEETAAILKEIRDRIGKPPKVDPVQPTPDQIRMAIKERTGFTDEQLDHNERSTRAAVEAATAPLKEKVAWSELKEKVGSIDPDIKTEMDKELAQYPAHMRGDAVLLDKVYWMAYGHSAYKRGGASKPTEEAVKDDSLVERRVVPGTPGSSRGLSGSGSPASKKVSDEERALYKKFGIKDDAEWEKYKGTQVISQLK